MIQRIQTLYLLLSVALIVAAMCLPIGSFIAPDGVTTHVLKPLGLTLADGTCQSTWGLWGILLLDTVVAACTIFLYKNRMLQVRTTVFNTLLMAGYYLACVAFVFMLKGDLEGVSFTPGWALCFPAIAIILHYLAFRGIMSDEVMVRAADRLR